MLTSHHSLLSGIAAVLCATGVVYQSAPKSTFQSLSQASIEQLAPNKNLRETLDLTLIQTADASYRGSGRLDDEPVEGDYTESNTEKIAHRGSGRVAPQSL